jgi:alcohol dehydrogenase
MRAVHLEAGVVTVREVPRPVCPKDFALLRLRCAGICNTDLELQRGYYGFAGTPGHEFVADVVESDDARLLGRRVTGEINLGCGTCEWCARGWERHCPTRTVLGIVRHPGAFQEFFTLPERNLHPVPDGMSDETAVFAEPVAAACEILDQVSMAAGADVAVLGDGKLGLLIAQVLHAHGCRVRLFGRHVAKLRLAAAGIETSLVDCGVPAAAFEWVVDATGSAEGLQAAVRMTRPRGTLILKSTVHGAVALDTAAVIVNEITLVGSRCGRFEAAMPLLEQGRIRVEETINGSFPLAEAAAAFQRAGTRGVLKVLLRPE